MDVLYLSARFRVYLLILCKNYQQNTSMGKYISKAELKDYLISAYPLSERDIERILEEINGFYDITVHDYIQSRHQELISHGKKNNVIYQQLLEEINERRFRAPKLSQRQVRRIIYG